MRIQALHGMLGATGDWDFLSEVDPVDLWSWDCGFDRIELDAEVVIGYSMGGRLALHALTQVKAAVIVSAHTGLVSGREERLACDLVWAEKASSLEWEAFLSEWHAQAVFSGSVYEPDRSALEVRREEIALAFDRWSLGRQANLLPELGKVEIPILWVNGALDSKFVQLGAAACEVLPQGEHAVIEGCGHRVPWEAPDRFSQLIKEFLSRHSLCR